MIFGWLEMMLADRLRRKFTSKIRKIQIKGTEILSYEECHCKTTQISEEIELYLAKWK